ncbi:FAD/NAD(P)-binding domain-containing protein [Cadophora sp. DSE1049]|nr:FAD/NAD(P)-binding domain-containing protein [Cadophora sp. DSE1049]
MGGQRSNGLADAQRARNIDGYAEYKVEEHAIGDPRHLRIVTIGAGAAGLNMARHLELHMQNFEHVIYEKNGDVGGTWYENRYPGCACDIPSHNYQFTWEPNPEWNHFYSPASEILQYFRQLAQKYELYKYIKLSHKIVGATWDEDGGIWNLEVEDLSSGNIIRDWCHFLINGSGVLNNWKWPDIPGIHSFEGELVHSATWDPKLSVKDKKVAVLGCGSSGVQIVPTIQPDVDELVTFIRTPTWITAGFAQDKAGPNGSNFKFSKEQKDVFRNNPDKYLAYRKEVEDELNKRFDFIIKDSIAQEEAMRFSTNEMKTKLGSDSQLVKHMIPDFAVGCRRPTPGNGYLEALVKPNVTVITEEISEIVPKGIKLKSGKVIEVDVFICATGFDISFAPRFPLVGRNGINLAKQWKTRPEAYLSMAAANMPNHFMFLGPNSPVGHGSLLPCIEHATKYIIRMLHKCQTQRIKAVAPDPQAISDFTEHIDVYMQRTAWNTHCRSWFKNGTRDGPIVALHPGSRVHWFHMLENLRLEDWQWTGFNKNRFAYLGNGFSTKEASGRDLSYYFNAPEEGYESIKY